MNSPLVAPAAALVPVLRSMWVLWRWEQRANLRLLRAQLASSLQTQMMALLVLIMIVRAWGAPLRGVLGRFDLSAPAQAGALAVALAVATASCALTTTALYVTVGRKRFARDPLRAHPGFVPLLRFYRLVIGVLAFVVPLQIVTFFVLFGDVVAARPHGLTRAAGFVAGCAVYFTLVALVTLRVAAWTSARRGLPEGLVTLRFMALANVILFLATPLVPVALAARHSRTLEQIGAVPMQAPLFAVLLFGLAAVVSVWRSWRALRFRTLADVAAERAGGDEREYRSAFSRRRRARAGWRLFWVKDVSLPMRRSPGTYVQEQWVLLGGAVVLVVAGRSLVTALSPLATAAAIVAVMLVSVAILAGLRGLPSLGSEGPQARLLLAVIRPQALFAVKSAACALVAAGHGAVYGAALAGLGLGLGLLEASWVPLVTGLAVLTALAGGAFGVLAAGVGFLLPAFDARVSVLPGASRAGLVLYLLIVAVVTPPMALVAVQWVGGADPAAVAGALVVGVMAAGGAGGVLGMWGASQLEELEW